MESRVPVSGTLCIVQARRHVPWIAKVRTAWPRSKATRIRLRRFCVIDHAGRIRKASLPGFAIPQNPELKNDGFTRPSREMSNVVPNTQGPLSCGDVTVGTNLFRENYAMMGTDLAGPGAVSPQEAPGRPFEMVAPLEV